MEEDEMALGKEKKTEVIWTMQIFVLCMHIQMHEISTPNSEMVCVSPWLFVNFVKLDSSRIFFFFL